MEQECQPDAIVRARLDRLKKDFSEYIEKNIDKIDANIPVFFGHVITTLESMGGISDDLHDRFIDGITLRVLETSRMSGDISYIERLFDYAERHKRTRGGGSLFDIVAGIMLVNSEKYPEAIERLKRYRHVDVMICTSIAYSHLVQTPSGGGMESDGAIRGPTANTLASREQMIELIRLNPPVNRLREIGLGDDPGINRIFWFMLKKAIEWFPEHREFLRIGIEKASKDGRRDIKEEILGIAIERFFDDMFFLRELYKVKLENRDAGGVAGVVRQMTQQFPDEPEPVYYGIKLAVITGNADVYTRFRKMALAKNIPAPALALLDFAFEMMSGRKQEAFACLDEIRAQFGPHHHFTILLEYAAHDLLSEDEKRVKQAKKALIDAIDHYCLSQLKKPIPEKTPSS